MRLFSRRVVMVAGGLAAALALAVPSAGAKSRLVLASPAFKGGGPIPTRYTCDGRNVSPALGWTAPPARTRSLAIRLDDPDAPGGPFTHWLGWNIAPRARGLVQGQKAPVEGRTSFGRIGYGGPCPPRGDAPHRYVFTLYALDTRLALARGADRAAFARALRGHVLATASLVGKYGR